MIIPLNNVHLFQQQSDKLYLCCTFGLLAWTLLSNVSQLGILLTRKPSEQLSNHQCFLDIVLFKSTTKGHFLTLHTSTLRPFSSFPSSSWPKKIKRILSYISCMPSLSTESLKHYQGWPKKLNATTQLEKPPIKPWPSTWETPPLPAVPEELQRGLTDHLGISLHESGLKYRHPHTAVTRQHPHHSRIAGVYRQPAAEVLMLLLYFREIKA